MAVHRASLSFYPLVGVKVEKVTGFRDGGFPAPTAAVRPTKPLSARLRNSVRCHGRQRTLRQSSPSLTRPPPFG